MDPGVMTVMATGSWVGKTCLTSEASISPDRMMLRGFNIPRRYVPAYGRQIDLKERCDSNDEPSGVIT